MQRESGDRRRGRNREGDTAGKVRMGLRRTRGAEENDGERNGEPPAAAVAVAVACGQTGRESDALPVDVVFEVRSCACHRAHFSRRVMCVG